MALRRQVTFGRAAAGLVLAAGAVVLPIALARPRPAEASALVFAHQRAPVLDALRTQELAGVAATSLGGGAAELAVDGRDETAWMGRTGETRGTWTATFVRPVHLGLLRARLGVSPTSGVPTAYHWDARPPSADGTCAPAAPPEDGWVALRGAGEAVRAGTPLAQPTRRSWFVDADACALRLVVDATNAGPPALRQVQAIESARDVLTRGTASDDGAYPGFSASDAIDERYATRWAGAPGKVRWTLRVDLPGPVAIDRVRLVLGFDATTVPRPGSGRSYAVAWGPQRYELEGSEDGKRFFRIAGDPTRSDGSILPLRRRLVTLPAPRTVRAVRLVMTGATGASGAPEPGAVPVVREMAAYAADDPRPVLAPPWVLSVNANPSRESHLTPGGEVTNDAYWAKFLQRRFALVSDEMRRDDRYDRALGPRGEPLDAPPHDEAGEMLEAIEGDDPVLDAQLLSQSSPPPITVLSGSDDWDYAAKTAPDGTPARRWYWDPLRAPSGGGMGQLGIAVRQRVAPFLGFCGGAQILALLEAEQTLAGSADDDGRMIDRVLRRTSGHPIRGFAPPIDVERAWPGETHPRARVQFLADEPLFADIAGPSHRSVTQALPESHSDAVRADAFLPGAPLDRFQVIASSAFCAPDVVAASPRDGVFPNPDGPGWCDTVPQAFRSKDASWPILGTQFHPEQRDFAVPGPGDPPESVADARLFFTAAYEEMVDAYLKLAP